MVRSIDGTGRYFDAELLVPWEPGIISLVVVPLGDHWEATGTEDVVAQLAALVGATP